MYNLKSRNTKNYSDRLIFCISGLLTILILLSFLLVVINDKQKQQSFADTATKNFSTYNNGNISIEYPSSWMIEKKANLDNHTIVLFFAPANNNSNPYAAAVSIKAIDFKKINNNLTYPIYDNYSYNQLSYLKQNYNITAFDNNTNISNNTGYEVDFNNKKIFANLDWTAQNNFIYSILFIGNNNTYIKYSNTFDTMIGSFKILR